MLKIPFLTIKIREQTDGGLFAELALTIKRAYPRDKKGLRSREKKSTLTSVNQIGEACNALNGHKGAQYQGEISFRQNFGDNIFRQTAQPLGERVGE